MRVVERVRRGQRLAFVALLGPGIALIVLCLIVRPDLTQVGFPAFVVASALVWWLVSRDQPRRWVIGAGCFGGVYVGVAVILLVPTGSPTTFLAFPLGFVGWLLWRQVGERARRVAVEPFTQELAAVPIEVEFPLRGAKESLFVGPDRVLVYGQRPACRTAKLFTEVLLVERYELLPDHELDSEAHLPARVPSTPGSALRMVFADTDWIVPTDDVEQVEEFLARRMAG